MSVGAVIESLEGVIEEARSRDALVLVDATLPGLSYSQAGIERRIKKVRAPHEIDFPLLYDHTWYYSYLKQLASYDVVRTSKRVRVETARLLAILKDSHAALRGSCDCQKSEESLRFLESCVESLGLYVERLKEKELETEEGELGSYFRCAKAVKKFTTRKRKRRSKLKDMYGEDSLAAIALSRGIGEGRSTVLLSNDHHLRCILNNFLVLSEVVDLHEGWDVQDRLRSVPISMHRLWGKKQDRDSGEEREGYVKVYDTSDPAFLQDVVELSESTSLSSLRKVVYSLHHHLGGVFGVSSSGIRSTYDSFVRERVFK